MAKAADKKAAEKNGSGVDEKTEKAANELRKQGATAAILSHTLGIAYGQAQRLAAAYDEKVGHAPQKVVRQASEIKLAGYTVKDGAKQAAPKKAKAKVAAAKA